jgi:hypothetical protein
VLIPGLKFLPWDIFGFIDCSIDQISTPFSGPRGDYEGAARRAEFPDGNRAYYTGYTKYHGYKVLTVVTPDGMSYVYGPVSARPNDIGVLHMSNLNDFLHRLQLGLFQTSTGDEIIYSVFGDGIFNLGLRCISSRFQVFGEHLLTLEQLLCNRHSSSARMSIEKTYGMTSSLFRVCANKEWSKLAKRTPYSAEQLRVSHLLVNCYACCQGDQVSNTFGMIPPPLDEYLGIV